MCEEELQKPALGIGMVEGRRRSHENLAVGVGFHAKLELGKDGIATKFLPPGQVERGLIFNQG